MQINRLFDPFWSSQAVWDPHTISTSARVEAVQRRAARFVTNQYDRTASVSDMLGRLQWEPLVERRRQARLVMFHKIHSNAVAVSMPLQSKGHIVPTRTENSQAYVVPSSRTDYHRLSFFPRTAREWNGLPESAVLIASSDSFRLSVQKGAGSAL